MVMWSIYMWPYHIILPGMAWCRSLDYCCYRRTGLAWVMWRNSITWVGGWGEGKIVKFHNPSLISAHTPSDKRKFLWATIIYIYWVHNMSVNPWRYRAFPLPELYLLSTFAILIQWYIVCCVFLNKYQEIQWSKSLLLCVLSYP